VFRLNNAETCNAKMPHQTFRSYEKRKASKKKKRKNLAVLAATESLFLAKLSSSGVNQST